MNMRNSEHNYGLIAVLLHWIGALAVIGLFALGLWMTGLDYYSPWYRQGPDLHRGIGVLLMLLFGFRLVWRMFNPRPRPLGRGWENRVAEWVHRLTYLLVFAIGISGYLISTADGRALAVFTWFEIPALISGIPNQEDLAGEVHYVLAWGLIVLAGAHALAALKHHFFDRDQTLLRIFGRAGSSNS